MKSIPQKKYHILIVIAFLIILYVCLGIQKNIPLRPQSIHQWAQCDRASVALNYFHDGMNFFLPRVHNLDNGSGITGMEFPFVNYSAAILYKIFGFHEYLYRLLTLFIFSSGLYFAFKIAMYWLRNFWKSIGVMLIFGCSPLLAFYSHNFLPEPSCLGFALGAWYFLLKHIETRKKKYLVTWYFFITLSSLIKLSSLINIPAMLLLIWLKTRSEERKNFIPISFVRVMIISGITFSWYYYAAILSERTHSEIFLLQSKFPESWFVFVDVWKQMRHDWFYRIYSDLLLIVLVVCLIAGIVSKKATQKELYFVTSTLFVSVFAFLISMWTQLRHHDYYMIPMYPLFLFGIISAVHTFNLVPAKIASVLLMILIPGTIAYQFYESKNHVRTSYKKDSWKYSPLHFDQFFYLEDVLRKNGIKRDDKVISVFDHTPEVSLYLMDQKGVTVAYKNAKNVFDQYFNSGVFSYVIYNKGSEFEEYSFHPEKYSLEQVFINANVEVYKVSSKNKLQNSQALFPAYLSPWN